MDNEITIKLHDDGKLLSVVSKGKFKLNLEDNLSEEKHCGTLYYKGEKVHNEGCHCPKDKPWPQEGDVIYFINSEGKVISKNYEVESSYSHCLQLEKFGNMFQTKEEAQMYSLRIESLSKGTLGIITPGIRGVNGEIVNYVSLILDFKNEEERQEWYNEFGKSWLYLLNNNKK